MPNWCSNQATIHGTKEQILELAGAYDRGGVCEHFLPSPIGIFENVADYRRICWGMKWDFGKTAYTPDEECDWQVDETGFGVAHLRFETAWSPPIGLYERFNALDMTVEAYYYEPLMQFYGQWSNPVEGILDEYFSFDTKKEIPYTIRMWFINDEDLEEETV